MAETLEQIAWRLFSTQFKKHKKFCTKVVFKAGSTIVDDGIFKAPQKIKKYCAVPLMYIESGSMSVIEYGKAVKYYNKGDCMGLFEAACYVDRGITKRIGRWSVVATTDVVVLVSSAEFLHSISDKTKNALVTAAKDNPIAKPISKIPLLDWFAKVHNIRPQKDILIAYHGHVLNSSIELIKHLAFVAGSENTFVLEKPYSTLYESFKKVTEGGVKTYQIEVDPRMSFEYSVKRNVDFFWQEIIEHVRANHIKKIIVLSDGADVLLSPLIKELNDTTIIGVEQTARGHQRLAKSELYAPVVSIANTRAKKQYESIFIASAALAKIKSECLLDNRFNYGVLGAGSMGREIIRGLNAHGITPLVYDPISPFRASRNQAQSLETLVQKSDVIIGTTGTDCLRGLYMERITGKKTFISTSSSNIEFAYLFDLAKRYANQFEDVALHIDDSFKAIILNGGYPINFDRIKEWEAPEDIQLTRALMYAGVYEALNSRSLKAKVKSLNSKLELRVTKKWLEMKDCM